MGFRNYGDKGCQRAVEARSKGVIGVNSYGP